MEDKNEIKLIKSVSDNQIDIIKDIIKLYIPNGQIDCDPTYSKGIFYNNTEILRPQYVFDIIPQYDFVQKGDARNLPFEDNTLNSIMFDPPFLATTGKSLTEDKDNNLINKRFGVYDNEIELHTMYKDSLKEFYRILKDKGILIFKCQDKVSSGKQYMSHVFIINEAEKLGFYTKDLFILLSKSRLVADWQLKNQKHSRKFHSYFIVFEKNGKKIQYV